MKPLILKAGAGCTEISFDDALNLFGSEAIEVGEMRGKIKTSGTWSIITGYQAVCTTATWKDIGISYNVVDEYTIYGLRTMFNIKPSGYDLEGYCSINGKKHSCFTSSILFKLPDGKLIDVAVIHARTK